MCQVPTTSKGDLPPELEQLTGAIIGCAIEVHRTLGPGLLESLYEEALTYELGLAGLSYERQVRIRVPYKAILLPEHVVDMIVERSVIVELKVVEALKDVHKAQTLTHARLTELPVGLLINFNESVLKNGVRRLINERSPLLSPSSPRPPRLRVQNGLPMDPTC